MNADKLRNVVHAITDDERYAIEQRINSPFKFKASLIALYIREYMRMNNVSNEKMQAFLSCDEHRLNEILSGQCDMTLSTLCKIEEIIGIEFVIIK